MISFESGSKSIQRRTATRFKSQFPPTHPTPSVHMQSILQVGISRPNKWDSLRAFIREKKKRKKEILKIVRYRSSTLLQKQWDSRIPYSVRNLFALPQIFKGTTVHAWQLRFQELFLLQLCCWKWRLCL